MLRLRASVGAASAASLDSGLQDAQDPTAVSLRRHHTCFVESSVAVPMKAPQPCSWAPSWGSGSYVGLPRRRRRMNTPPRHHHPCVRTAPTTVIAGAHTATGCASRAGCSAGRSAAAATHTSWRALNEHHQCQCCHTGSSRAASRLQPLFGTGGRAGAASHAYAFALVLTDLLHGSPYGERPATAQNSTV